MNSGEKITASQSAHIAVVGCGYWGKNLARNFAQLRVLRSISDTNEKGLAEQSKLYPEVCLNPRFEEVLDDEKIRGVVVATPAVLHFEQARQAILKGKDVFVEKPLALRYDEGKELVRLAEAHGAVLMVGHILEYHPAIKKLKEIIFRGELGRVWYLYSNRLNLGKVRREENILWSFAPHDISVILTLVSGEPDFVSAQGGSYLQSGIADVTVTSLLFSDGTKAHIFVSWLHPYKEQKLVVIGEQKMAVFDDMVREGKLKIFDKGIEWKAGFPVPRQTAETTLFFEESEPLRLECEHFLACIRDRSRPLSDGRSALSVLKVLEAGQISLGRNGEPVPLADVEKGGRG